MRASGTEGGRRTLEDGVSLGQREGAALFGTEGCGSPRWRNGVPMLRKEGWRAPLRGRGYIVRLSGTEGRAPGSPGQRDRAPFPRAEGRRAPFPLRRDDARLSRTEGRRPVLQDSGTEGQIPFLASVSLGPRAGAPPLGGRDGARGSRTKGQHTFLENRGTARVPQEQSDDKRLSRTEGRSPPLLFGSEGWRVAL